MELNFLCPVCRAPLINGKDSLTCSNGHAYHFNDNVLILLPPEKQNKIDSFISNYFEYKKIDGTLSVFDGDFQSLPYIKDSGTSKEWQFRKYSLEIVDKLTGNLNIKTALEFGPYNGWLSNRLSSKGYDLTVVDYFSVELTGLRAIKHYANKWLPVQMDLRDLSIINKKFDLIVFNHSLHFFNSYSNIIKDAKELLNPGGVIIILGIPVYKDPASIIKSVKDTFVHFKTVHNFDYDLFNGEFRGYFDIGDKAKLKSSGLKLTGYPKLRLKNIAAKVISKRPEYYYGVLDLIKI